MTQGLNVQKKSLKLTLRNATLKDIPRILALTKKVYPNWAPYPTDTLQGQITNFSDGCFVVEDENENQILGYSASILLKEKRVLKSHTWNEITGGGFGTTHNAKGDYLYGYEICVDPDQRGTKIGQRLYNARKELVKYHRLKGIAFAGRVSGLKKKKGVDDPQVYIDKVLAKEFRDTSLTFQIRNGFEVKKVLKNYLPEDTESKGYGVLMTWENPEYNETDLPQGKPPLKNTVRVATVQYQQRGISSFDEFKQMAEYFVDVTSDWGCDFVLFPEFIGMQLLSLENEELKPHEAIEKMSIYHEDIKDMFSEFAVKYNINIIGGTHPVKKAGSVKNVAGIYLRDGSTHEQEKIHPTPDEAYWWNIEGGDEVNVIQTDCGPIGVLICYDSEFPELTRHLVNQGAKMLFVPFFTSERQGYCRVRYCCHARAVENQIYVAMSGSVGNLPRVHNMDIQYAQSCILTPCDFSFSRDGIAADTTPNVETVALADLRIDSLIEARNDGSVQNLKDRRHDLYTVKWLKS
jgi:predicted amidohydrolase/ribosomal protein S18 acetylase RimI-like enzyme